MGSLDLNLSETSQFKPLDHEEFRKQAHQMVDFIADYYKNIETYISGSPSGSTWISPYLPPWNHPVPTRTVRTVLEADVAAGLVPLYLCATDVANDFGLWVHVDAAYGGSSCICPGFRHHFNGIERVDSLMKEF
ncbi:GROUP II PYRIDOXAL-5-PHOSPHATE DECARBOXYLASE [Salix koriyanagi]|uniref:GROUP II PYRIDOXAL-5-PHOSPHATE DECARBOXYLASE n=1 Tax=Salix koriyanagi TaxID=2511006 RepID=A0A9Q0W7P1_9ROSI|nr:GROUP II PYRIDOXAL-5-PHOSPHATE DECARBOXYLASE [Salix koriyanagi]